VDKDLYIVIFFAVIGFLSAVVTSAVAGVSAGVFLLRVLLFTLIMSGFGFGLYFMYKKTNENTLNDNNKTAENKDNLDYSNLFQKKSELENDEDSDENDEDFDEEQNSDKIKNSEQQLNSDDGNDIPVSEDVLKSLEKENIQDSDEGIMLNSENLDDSLSDNEIDMDNINQNDEAMIKSTSSQSSSSNIDEIDDQFIYMKDSKIENKPEKIARVISDLIKDDKSS